MTANSHSIDLSALVAEHLERAEPDLLRSMLRSFIPALMSAEADAVCGAAYGVRSAERTNSRNGYRARDFDTRAGTGWRWRSQSCGKAPTFRSGCRSAANERALVSVVATSYLLGVSTRRMEKLVETLGITRLSKSQVSVMGP
jgi:putative transposase